MEPLNLKVPQKKVLELYGMSRTSFFNISQKLGFTKYYFGDDARKPYYDLQEIEEALRPKSSVIL